MPKDTTKRLFISLNVPSATTGKIEELIEKLEKDYPRIRWAKESALHITLHFLGNLDAENEKNVKLAMQSVAGKFHEPFRFSLNGLGGFPGWQNPRVIYVGCSQINGKSVYTLHKMLTDQLAQLGIATDKRVWQPHITIGRVKDRALNGFNRKWQKEEIFTVSTFELMESNLTPTGARYNVVASYRLF
jgi:2'-5' RNA ligase